MEIHENSMVLQNSSNVTVADSVWKFINSPVIAIFSDLNNPTAKQMLSSLLESILKGSATLTTILVPPFSNGMENETLRRRYSAFTTWLFGAMFYIIGNPLSDEILNNSIEIQACMLRILSRHHITMFNTISNDYMNLLQEITVFYRVSSNDGSITLTRFNTERDIIENLVLQAFPLVVKHPDIPFVQTSILKIMKKTDISGWDKQMFYETILKVMTVSIPSVKSVALDLSAIIVESSLYSKQEVESLVLYAIDAVKALPMWINLGLISGMQLNQFLCIFVQFIASCPLSQNSTELCFKIIDFTVNELKR